MKHEAGNMKEEVGNQGFFLPLASCFLLLASCFLPLASFAKLENKIKENEKQFGSELVSKQFSEDDRNFSGKKVYHFPLYGWQVEVLYINNRSASEVVRPKGDNFKKKMITESEANVIADMLYPKKDRGPYRKQVKNANFISHFFERGVISYEMELDKRRKNHIGVIGVRALLYSNGDVFKNIMINAYH